MCSRLVIGSASTPRRASKPDTADAIRSRYASPCSIRAAEGAANDRSTVIGSPAELPGV
ncbi:hypothetical protein [Planctomyces sp. SH-PL62]|uniref:hypothetical protein n=1 Tax=Planctomyces sp. SH-PL62 TaxID=1636152 RepID=UPI00078BBF0F|nr:hypothetical protein [Planctomyces sp. SH-PL62]AMV37914.1 hypothetical protein VT85_10795 [Planctomyces sp. SH-PL62]